MSNKTRKRLWPVSLVMAVAIIGVLAAFLALGTTPTNTEAHDGASGSTHCDDLGTAGFLRETHDDIYDHTCAEGQTAQPLDAPANPMLVAGGATVDSLEFTWDAVAGASRYRVEYMGPDDNNTFRVFGIVSATTAKITGLTPDTRYTIAITAVGVSGQSLDSDRATFEANTAQVAYDLTVNGEDSIILRSVGEHTVRAEVVTDSPADQTTVAVRIDESNGTMYLDDDPGITYTQSGLRGVGERSDDVGNLVIDIRDAATRVFTLNVECTADNSDELKGVLDIEIRDDEQRLVAEASVSCAPPVETPAPEERASACYAISGMPDRIGDDDRTANEVEFSDVELYTTDKSVQLRVTSYQYSYQVSTVNDVATITQSPCPHWPQPSVFIRLVDTPGTLPAMPMVDDEGGFVDENGLIDNHGEVVGVSSGGELVFDIEGTRGVRLTETETRTTGVREATFIVFTPEDVEVGDQYFVELYDYRETQRIEHLHRDPNRVRLYDRTRAGVGYYDGLTEVEQEYERVVYVASPDVLPTKLAVTTYSDRPGVALLSWTPVVDAERHHAIVVHNGAAVAGSYAVVTQVGADGRMSTTVTGLEENKEYIFAVVAENTDNDGQPQYSELAVLSQEMDWQSGS